MRQSKQSYWVIRSKPLSREGAEVVRVVKGINLAEQTVRQFAEEEQEKDRTYHLELRQGGYTTDPAQATAILLQELDSRNYSRRKPTKRELKIAKLFKKLHE